VIDESPPVGRRGNWVAARGCALCRGTGFKGRLAVAELLVVDDDMRRRILEREPPAKLRDAARLRGTVLLRDAAMEAAARGLTTVDEVLRVTREDN
jgi:general secretion pathway protein E